MLEQWVKPYYLRVFIHPMANCIQGTEQIRANHITIFASIIGLFAMPALAIHQDVFALFCILTSGYLDSLDGEFARIGGQSNAVGTVLDIISDRTVEAAILLGLYLYAPETRALYILGMFAATYLCVTSFLVVGLFTENRSDKGFHYSPGIIERAEAFIIFTIMVAWPQSFTFLACAYILFVLLTTIIRLKEFIQ